MKNQITCAQVSIAAAIAACSITVGFAAYLLVIGETQSVASWALWTALNLLNWYAMKRAGSKETMLPFGYAVGCGLVTLMVIKNGGFAWWPTDSVAAVCAVTAFLLSQNKRMPGNAGIFLAILSMWIAAVPVTLANLESPQLFTWWLWAGTGTCNAVALTTVREWRFPAYGYAASGVLFNLGMLAIVTEPLWRAV